MAASYGCYADRKKVVQLHRFVWSEFFYTQDDFLYQKKSYFISFLLMIVKADRIMHVTSQHTFFSTRSTNLILKKKSQV